MRTVLLATALVAGFAAVASAQAMQQMASVASVDRGGKSFTTWLGSTSTYKTTPNTTFRVGATPTSWAAVKVGDKVAIKYHAEGKNSVADEVVINQ